MKLKTLEGIFSSIFPSGTKKKCFDINGNSLGLFYLYEFPITEDFLTRVSKIREKKTRRTNRKTLRDDNLENVLNSYYSNDEFCQKKIKTKNEELCNNQEMKRCGIRLLGDNEKIN